MLSLISVPIGGCATRFSCGGWEKVDLSHKDVLTRTTKEKVVANNEYGEAQGCWTANKPESFGQRFKDTLHLK